MGAVGRVAPGLGGVVVLPAIQHERPGFEHQNAAAARCICNEKTVRYDASERPASDDNGIEIAGPTTDRLCRTIARLLQGVAKKTPLVVQ